MGPINFPMNLNTLLTPLRALSISNSNSGTGTPRMTLSRESSVSAISLYERLDEVRQEILLGQGESVSAAFLPNEIIWIIMSHVARNCNRIGRMSDLLNCTLIDKRFHQFATAFLYCNVTLCSDNAFTTLHAVLKDKARNRGEFVQKLTFLNVAYINGGDWFDFLSQCPNLSSLCIEKCHIDNHYSRTGCLLRNLRSLTMSDCATCPPEPILDVCQMTVELEKLSIMGCNYNEDIMCEMISHTPRLQEIKLGSHAGASLTSSGSAGGDRFATILAEKCPHLISADLTGIISMTDSGWTAFIGSCGPRLEKLCVRRAMQVSLDQLLLVSTCTNLRRLTLANVPHLTDEAVIQILDSIGNQLTFLQFESLLITDSVLDAVVKNGQRLVQFRIYSCNQLESLGGILYAPSLRRLRYLILHNCKDLGMEVHCDHPEQTPIAVDSAVLAPLSKIKYLSSMSPMSLEPPSPSVAMGSTPLNNGECNLQVYLYHLEIVDCPMIREESIDVLIRHCNKLKRFIYVGEALDSKIRKKLKANSNIKYSIYVLTPTTPFL